MIEPAAEASVEAGPDVSAETSLDAGHDAVAEAATPDVSDAPVEADVLVEADACVPEEPYDAAGGPCTKGTIEKQWCGACGRKQRFCGNDGQWKEWSDCLEDELSVCIQCEAREVSCGFCGKRRVTCETSQGTCRWALGVCDQTGECVAGDWDTDANGCPQGQVRVRRCESSCAWADAGACEAAPGWEPLPSAPISGRKSVASVVAGAKWFLWGGAGESGYLEDGATFDSAASEWQALAPATWPTEEAAAGGLSARAEVAIAWTGSEVVMFGGVGEGDAVLGDGARWREASGWSALSGSGAPAARRGATAVWAETAGVVIVWGGLGKYGGAASGGGRYDPSSDAWQAVSAAPIGGRQGHVAVWEPLHGRMIVWGGAGDGPPERSGAAYDPQADTWTAVSEAPIRRSGAFGFWDSASARMIVLMGEDGAWNGPRGDGAAYDPSSDSWVLLPDLALSGYLPGWGEAAAWGNGRAWVTGGDVSWAVVGLTGLGAQYDSQLDTWGKLPAMPEPRAGHAAVWLGGLLVWGGKGPGGFSASGVRLRESGLWP